MTAAAEIIVRDFPGMTCLPQSIGFKPTVRYCVIPTAGMVGGLFPASKTMSPGLLPIVDADGVCKPAALILVEQALQAGMEKVVLVVAPHAQAEFEMFFSWPVAPEVYNTLPPSAQAYSDRIREMGERVVIVVQESQEGFGHAVLTARSVVGDEPFLLMLGDHLYKTSHPTRTCVDQVLAAFDGSSSVIGTCVINERDVGAVAVMACAPSESGNLVVREIAEKPSLDYARANLVIRDSIGEGLDAFYGAFGLYVLQPVIFNYLESLVASNMRTGGGFPLTPCLERLRKEAGLQAKVIQGVRFDIGRDTPTYLHAITQYGLNSKELATPPSD